MKLIDLTDRKFGYLKVIERAGSKKYKNGTESLWKCRCKCGKVTIVSSRNLRTGHTQSCGCLRNKASSQRAPKLHEAARKHGYAGTRLYKIWHNMKDRCYNPDHVSYKQYGERGITICDEWRENFEAFRTWALQNGYKEGLTIDRKKVNVGYNPDNCRWASVKEQNNNKRNNMYIEYQGKRQSAQMWSEETGIKYQTILDRFHKGLSPEQILKEAKNV